MSYPILKLGLHIHTFWKCPIKKKEINVFKLCLERNMGQNYRNSEYEAWWVGSLHEFFVLLLQAVLCYPEKVVLPSLGCGSLLGSSPLQFSCLFLPLPLVFEKMLWSSDLQKVNKCWTSVESIWSLQPISSPRVKYPVSFNKHHPLLVWGGAHE